MEKSKKIKIIIITVVALVLVSGVAFACIAVNKSNTSKSNEVKNEQKENNVVENTANENETQNNVVESNIVNSTNNVKNESTTNTAISSNTVVTGKIEYKVENSNNKAVIIATNNGKQIATKTTETGYSAEVIDLGGDNYSVVKASNGNKYNGEYEIFKYVDGEIKSIGSSDYMLSVFEDAYNEKICKAIDDLFMSDGIEDTSKKAYVDNKSSMEILQFINVHNTNNDKVLMVKLGEYRMTIVLNNNKENYTGKFISRSAPKFEDYIIGVGDVQNDGKLDIISKTKERNTFTPDVFNK